jgi:hypothetical protein
MEVWSSAMLGLLGLIIVLVLRKPFLDGLTGVIQATYEGKAKLIRARRGDPELADQLPSVPRPRSIQRQARARDAASQ